MLGNTRQKRRNFYLTPLAWVALAMEDNVSSDPVDVGFLRPRAVVPRPNGCADPIAQLSNQAGAMTVVTSSRAGPPYKNALGA